MTESSKPPFGRRMKPQAPPPPQAPQPAPRHIFRNSVPDGGGTSGADAKENILRPTVDLQLTLPQGYQTSVTEDGSKALMDLLVELCSRYHLNPALHTLELLSPEGRSLGFKPNALLGSFNVACVLIKEKVWEDKVVRRPAPKVPEKTVRLMVNYHGSQKAVVRVNPFVPLQALIPVICDKCEFDPAHVLLLRDSISRHELALDKSLTDLGIKELYVHDHSLVLQPKMSSAPALYYSDSIHSSTATLGRAEKKGLLGIFQFSRGKSKTEATSMDMDDYDDKVIQNTATKSSGLSTVSGDLSVNQSQSVMNLPRMSPKAETKKRRAPAPPGTLTPIMGQTGFGGYQIGLGSESQQRKRKAPAPPPTPASITPGSDDTSMSASMSDSHKTPTPALRTSVAESNTVSSTTAETQTINPVCLQTAAQPTAVCYATPTTASPTPSSSTTDSLAAHDSSSELSHSLDDSDADLEQDGSHCSTLTSSTASEFQPTVKTSSSRTEELEKSSSMTAKFKPEVTSASSSRSDTESALNLKLDEIENNRQSAIGISDQPAPPKPPRSPALEPPQLVRPHTQSTPPPPSPPIEPTESNSPQSSMEVEEAAPQSWLHSMQSSKASDQKPETETPMEENLSLGRSSSGSSLPDQGYAASEGMGEGEDSGVVCSPSDTMPTSPEGSLSLDESSRGRGEKKLRPARDSSSDSDEGCATWESRHRDNDITSQAKSSRLKDSYGDDPLTTQPRETLADFEESIADRKDVVSAKKSHYTMSTDSNDVPVSVVDIDVPVTAIDDVLEDYEDNIAENEAKSITRNESAGSKGPGFCHQSIVEPQNQNNNARTTPDDNKGCSADTEKLSQPKQHRQSMENKAIYDKKEEKMIKKKIKVMGDIDTRAKEDKRKTSAVKSNVDMQSESSALRPDPVKSNTQSFQEMKPDLPPNTQRSVSTEINEEMHKVFQNSSSSASSGKITRVTSRFGMRTFTVVPPKPSVVHAATGEPAGSLTAGAIKIDDQGNMVKVGVYRNKGDRPLRADINCKEESVLLEKAKAFWTSNERHDESVPQSKGLIDRVKEENMDSLRSTPTVILETTLKANNADNKKTESAQPTEMLKEEAKEPVKDVQVAKEKEADEENKFSVSKNIEPPSNKPTPSPLFPEFKRDISFFKPSRRTSSQYVASAITKCSPKTLVNPNSVPDFSSSVKTHSISYQRSGQSMQVNPHQSSRSSLSDIQETDSSSKPKPTGPKRSVSYPEEVSAMQRDFGEVSLNRGAFGSSVVSTKGSTDVLETKTARDKLIQSSGPIQTNMTTNNDGDNNKHIRPTPAQSSLLLPSAKLHTNPKTISYSKTSDMKDMTQTPTHLTPDVKPPSVTVSDSSATPGPLPVTVFGPVKKFRPVVCGPVAKETSLHSNLMEAIQTGRGRDKLKKISDPCNTKKVSYDEEQNERSALLAAIRAQNNSTRLKKTKSEAADELEKFRKAASEQEKSADAPSSSTPPSLTSTSAVFIPPPPLLPAPMIVPPPPPPILPKGKPSTVAHPNANSPMNPALARQAMLEAIRSGSAAERLKKVAVPTKTVQVNGRQGTIHATSSTLPRQKEGEPTSLQ